MSSQDPQANQVIQADLTIRRTVAFKNVMNDLLVIICHQSAANALQTTLSVCGHTVSNVMGKFVPMEHIV